jgi:hypothetical protein
MNPKYEKHLRGLPEQNIEVVDDKTGTWCLRVKLGQPVTEET